MFNSQSNEASTLYANTHCLSFEKSKRTRSKNASQQKPGTLVGKGKEVSCQVDQHALETSVDEVLSSVRMPTTLDPPEVKACRTRVKSQVGVLTVQQLSEAIETNSQTSLTSFEENPYLQSRQVGIEEGLGRDVQTEHEAYPSGQQNNFSKQNSATPCLKRNGSCKLNQTSSRQTIGKGKKRPSFR